jgi:hypothetical protein
LQEPTKKASELVHLEKWWATLESSKSRDRKTLSWRCSIGGIFRIIEKKHHPLLPPPKKRGNRKRLSRTLESEG